MKKIISLLLVLILTAGIGLGGTLNANASWAEEYLIAGMVEKIPLLVRLMPYSLLEDESFRQEFEAGLLPEKDLDDVIAAVNAVAAPVISAEGNEVLLVTVEEYEAVLTLCEAIFAENFTPAFLNTFKALQDACLQAVEQYFQAYTKLIEILENSPASLLSPGLLKESANLLSYLEGKNLFSLEENGGTLSELTAVYTEIAREISKGMEKIEAYSTMKWWEQLPGWLQWILKYLFFGWIWMG